MGYAEEDEDHDKEEEEDDDEEEEDEEDLILQDDDDYMDWLGEQLLNRKSGAAGWGIDAVHEARFDERTYRLWE